LFGRAYEELFGQMMSNRELSVICLRLKILVVYRLFREEKPPIPHLRPVSPTLAQPQNLANFAGCIGVSEQTPFQSSCLIFLRTYVALTLAPTCAGFDSPDRNYQWNFCVFFGKRGLASQMWKSLYISQLLPRSYNFAGLHLLSI